MVGAGISTPSGIPDFRCRPARAPPPHAFPPLLPPPNSPTYGPHPAPHSPCLCPTPPPRPTPPPPAPHSPSSEALAPLQVSRDRLLQQLPALRRPVPRGHIRTHLLPPQPQALLHVGQEDAPGELPAQRDPLLPAAAPGQGAAPAPLHPEHRRAGARCGPPGGCPSPSRPAARAAQGPDRQHLLLVSGDRTPTPGS